MKIACLMNWLKCSIQSQTPGSKTDIAPCDIVARFIFIPNLHFDDEGLLPGAFTPPSKDPNRLSASITTCLFKESIWPLAKDRKYRGCTYPVAGYAKFTANKLEEMKLVQNVSRDDDPKYHANINIGYCSNEYLLAAIEELIDKAKVVKRKNMY